MGMIVLLMKFLGNGIDPILVWKDGCSQEKLKENNELSIPFVDTLLHTITSYYFEWKLSIFYGLLFLKPQSVYLLLIKSWKFGVLFYCIYLAQFLEL